MLACHKGLANENLSVLEVNVLPLEAMDFTCTHASKEADNEIVLVVHANVIDEQSNFLESKGIDVCARDLERFEGLERGLEFETGSRRGHEKAEW